MGLNVKILPEFIEEIEEIEENIDFFYESLAIFAAPAHTGTYRNLKNLPPTRYAGRMAANDE